MELSKEEKKAIEWLKKAEFFSERLYAPIILNLIDKQQKLINIFISNEAVREDKDFNEIKEKYYECL